MVSAPSEVSDMPVATAGACTSTTVPLVQEVSSSSEETVVVSPSQVAGASPLWLVEEPASTPSISLRSVSIPLQRTEVNLFASEAADEGPTSIQGEDLGVKEATAGDEGSSAIGEEEPIPIEQPGAIVPDNKDKDMVNEGQEEGTILIHVHLLLEGLVLGPLCLLIDKVAFEYHLWRGRCPAL
ncbi:hypothetical protein AMTR_s00015p00251830 [Amborella trichopoda]|uniref:Uncharacterized protein n=1 Tax=Amborella trichopoda TaxID=13333 RepID=W1PG03_AMBTC|nr:hypothetical protein AMTR_s00015p00251830 [Amborella trichopoda]